MIRTAYGARLVERGTVVSRILSRPGPVHDIYDVMAVCVAVLSPGPRIALLGFAGGGIVAPLRAAGCSDPILAVDLSRRGEGVFRRLSSPWCEDVRLTKMEASAWLRRNRTRFDLIVEDLGIHHRNGPRKPPVCVEILPSLIRRRLSSTGVAVINALPVPGLSWKELLNRLARPFSRVRMIHFQEYENRFVIAGSKLPSARKISRQVRSSLRSIGSRMATRISVHTFAGS